MIVLVGFMGAGKSTVGRLVALRLGLPFRDADDLVVAAAGRSVAEIFTTEGEAAFRDLEAATVRSALDGHDGVLALGGGACERADTRAALAGHTVVHLCVSLSEAVRRVGGDPDRPVLADPALESRYAARERTFHDLADVVVDVDALTPQEAARAVETEVTS